MNRPPTTEPIPILLYHGVAEDADGPLAPWVVTPSEFERHMEIIEEEACRPVTVGALVRRVHDEARPPDPGTVVVTFDDGFADFATGAWPVLTRRGIPSTLYVTSGGVGSTARWLPGAAADRTMLDWSTLRDLADAGVEIGGHTHSHPQLDLLGRGDAQDEIRRGRATLEDELGRTVDTFAYPHGYHTGALSRLVGDEGHTSACGVGHAFSLTTDDRFALARVMIRHGDPIDAVRGWVRGEGLRIRPRGRRRALAAGWRQVRRVRGATSGGRTDTAMSPC